MSLLYFVHILIYDLLLMFYELYILIKDSTLQGVGPKDILGLFDELCQGNPRAEAILDSCLVQSLAKAKENLEVSKYADIHK